MKPSAVEKELNRQATLFEDKVKQGLISVGGAAHFGDYAREWIELQPLAPKTRELYLGLMDRITAAIGHIRLDKLTAHHLEQFYKNLSEPGVRLRAEYAVTNKLPAMLKKQKISAAALARNASVSDITVIAAKKGNHIRPNKAEAICKALNCPFDKLFTLKRDEKCLTGNTIAHYHRFICAVLMTTKNKFSVRDVRLSGFVFELLAQYRIWWNEHRLQYGADWKGEKERLFIQDDGLPLYPDTINSWLKKVLERNDLPYITPHSLRHTFCTLELAAGTDYKTLQSLSGHAQASTLVNIYGHVLESAQRKAADALERVLLPPENENID